MAQITESRQRSLRRIVEDYEGLRTIFDQLGRFLVAHLTDDERLKQLIHSGKFRTKNPVHLLDKLERKEIKRLKLPAAKRPPLLRRSNFLEQIDDLVGVRILHLHTHQMAEIHPTILEILRQNRYQLKEDPFVYIWDIENREFFRGIGISPIEHDEMYTSVHYIVSPANRPEMRIELQVRTLMEEVWGEVSHAINYPHRTPVVSCRDQLLALARITSGCTRLVDSIFAAHLEAQEEEPTGD